MVNQSSTGKVQKVVIRHVDGTTHERICDENGPSVTLHEWISGNDWPGLGSDSTISVEEVDE